METPQGQTDHKQLYRSRQAAIANLLKKLRKERGLTQAEVALLTGVDQSAISKLESGERGIKFVEVDFFANALGIGVGHFTRTVLETMWESDDPPLLTQNHT